MTKEEFLKDVDNWSNHRHLLWEALERTKHLGWDVIEMGCGDGSTPFLQKYCKDEHLMFESFDSNEEWANKFGVRFLKSWNEFPLPAWRARRRMVVLVDEAPGEHRKETIQWFAEHPDMFCILIVHDSEPVGWNASDYQVRPLFNRFKFVHDLTSEQPGGAWATWLSNEYQW